MSDCIATEGYVIRRQPFSNTSLIVRWLTRDHGIVTTMAKGAAAQRSKWRACLDLYHHCELHYRRSRTAEMHTLTEATLLAAHVGLRGEYARLLAANYFAALIDAISESDAPLCEEYDLFAKAIVYLESHSPTHRLVERFESRLLSAGGLHHEGQAVRMREDSGTPSPSYLPASATPALESASLAHDFRIPSERAILLREIAQLSPATDNSAG